MIPISVYRKDPKFLDKKVLRISACHRQRGLGDMVVEHHVPIGEVLGLIPTGGTV